MLTLSQLILYGCNNNHHFPALRLLYRVRYPCPLGHQGEQRAVRAQGVTGPATRHCCLGPLQTLLAPRHDCTAELHIRLLLLLLLSAHSLDPAARVAMGDFREKSNRCRLEPHILTMVELVYQR